MEKIKQDLTQFLAPYIPQLEKDKIKELIEEPRIKSHGFLTLRVFSLSPKNSSQYAQNLCQKLKKDQPSFITEIHSLSGFINFNFEPRYVQKIFFQMFDKNSFQNHPLKNERWVIDYSSPNIAKYMNVGHLRATVIGQAIVQMATFFGYQVIALNHLGDWGTQFGKLMVAYKKWGKEKTLSHLVDLYVRFHKEAEKDPSLEEESRQLFKKLEKKDEELLELWSSFVKISMANYNQIWKRLNVSHDLVQGESFYVDQVPEVEKVLKEKNLLQESQGAQVVFLSEKEPPCLIRKKDGTSTYASRDLASLFFRVLKLKASQCIYVTGVEQTFHFKQIKNILEKIQPEWRMKHLPFGMYRFKGKGKLSSRKGLTVSLSDLMDESCLRVLKIISEKNPSLENKDEVCEKVGIGALVFNDLKTDRTKDVEFSWENILNFDGDSGPYVQYCYVRCVSLLHKAHENDTLTPVNGVQNIESLEFELIRILLNFESQIHLAFIRFKPHILANYLLEVCHAFNRFYSEYKIIDSEKKEFRLFLVKAVKKVLSKGLSLLNIQTTRAM